MILSVSRRTDIPAFYSDWFLNRIKEGFVYVRNPMNIKQVSRVDLAPEQVDCIVFWSKDPLPLVERLHELREFKYYFQFTITPYGRDIETNIRDKREIVDTFIELSKMLGRDRVILRYDPILLTDKYTLDFHKRSFEKLFDRTLNYTDRIVISFLDVYRKISKNMKEDNMRMPDLEEMRELARFMGNLLKGAGISLESCAEDIELGEFGIKHGSCIDGSLIEKICGYKLKSLKKDGNRQGCLCNQSIDIGQYDSCLHGCSYCYANVNKRLAGDNYKGHDPKAPILLGDFDEESIKIRKGVNSLRDISEDQESFL